jgi:hypothetical protein
VDSDPCGAGGDEPARRQDAPCDGCVEDGHLRGGFLDGREVVGGEAEPCPHDGETAHSLEGCRENVRIHAGLSDYKHRRGDGLTDDRRHGRRCPVFRQGRWRPVDDEAGRELIGRYRHSAFPHSCHASPRWTSTRPAWLCRGSGRRDRSET